MSANFERQPRTAYQHAESLNTTFSTVDGSESLLSVAVEKDVSLDRTLFSATKEVPQVF